MDAPVIGSVRAPSHGQSCQPCYEPDWDGEEECLDAAVAEREDDGGEEVLEGLREDGEVLEEDEDVGPVVGEA